MKKYSIILLIIFSACTALRESNKTVSNNQSKNYKTLNSFKGDTLGYVQHNFINNKKKYVGKDLFTLLKDVEIPIKSYLPDVNIIDKNTTPAIYLQFYPYDQAMEREHSQNKPVDIIIVWSFKLPSKSIDSLWRTNKGEWKEAERIYFGKQIIKDIVTTDWNM